ncbi:MAG: ATP-binding protein [Dehalococcoidia bacterium]
MFSSLRARLVALVLIAVVPAFAVILYTGIEQRANDRDKAEQDALRLVELTAAQEGQFIEGGRQLLSGLALIPEIRSHDAAGCAALLSQLVAEEPRYSGLAAADANGDAFCIAPPAPAPVNISDRLYFQRAMQSKDFAVGEYVIGRASGKPTLGLGYPIFDADGGLKTFLVASVDLAWLNDLAAEVDLPDGAALTIIDGQGTVLARYPELDSVVGRPLPVTPLAQAILAEGTGTTQASGIDGVERLYAFAPLGDASQAGAYVSVGISTDAAFANANSVLLRNLIALAGVAVLALMAAWAVGDLFIVRNIRGLIAAAARLGAGDLTARAMRPHRTGELGQLALAFNDMAGNLEVRERERAEAGQALRKSEERFRSLVEQLADGLVAVDREGSITMMNAAAQGMFGYDSDEVLGQPIELLLPEQAGQAHVAHRNGYMGERTPRPMGTGLDLRGRRKDGSEFPVAISLTPLETGDGPLVAATVTDMTQRKEAEDQLQRAMDELTRSNMELEQFAYVASHDLQEPLRMVSNYTQLLARRYGDQLDEAAHEFIAYAADGATRMQQLIDDLLAFSRVGTRGKEFAPTDCEAVLERTLDNLRPSIEGAGATVTHDALPTIPADGVQVGQVFQNLITNAIKFRGVEPPRVHISAKQQAQEWLFAVTDNGIGIDPEYAERVFVIFQRLHGREEYPGTGIGLSVCKKVVERHGGRIWVEPAPDGGATFAFTVPARHEVAELAAA